MNERKSSEGGKPDDISPQQAIETAMTKEERNALSKLIDRLKLDQKRGIVNIVKRTDAVMFILNVKFHIVDLPVTKQR